MRPVGVATWCQWCEDRRDLDYRGWQTCIWGWGWPDYHPMLGVDRTTGEQYYESSFIIGATICSPKGLVASIRFCDLLELRPFPPTLAQARVWVRQWVDVNRG
ncbi:MAG: hypothetical protein F6J87_14705 [Spirulina sp. SIO3F2]|nr:hypothetical protein [Spirulina sp. SIO3F2]